MAILAGRIMADALMEIRLSGSLTHETGIGSTERRCSFLASTLAEV